VAPHSLRAVSAQSLTTAYALADGQPFHIHVAEQVAEVEEVKAATGTRPVQWLLDNADINASWCLVHATHMLPDETAQLASTGAVVGLCPVTESNLGDGIFPGSNYDKHNGRVGIGTDSNINIALSDELKTLEYSQRLKEQKRAVYAEPQRSTGRKLYDLALDGGAHALQRKTGAIKPGYKADLMALDKQSASFISVENDQWLDAWIFANNDSLITDVWAAGKHLVKDGRHIDFDTINKAYRATMSGLLEKL